MPVRQYSRQRHWLPTADLTDLCVCVCKYVSVHVCVFIYMKKQINKQNEGKEVVILLRNRS